MVAPVELVRELLGYRDMKLVTARDWGMITGLIAGASIAFPVLTPVAMGSLVVAGVQKLRALKKRKAIEGIELPPPRTVIDIRVHVVSGVARKLRAAVASIRGDDVLAEHVEIKDKGGGVILRRSESAPFWLERDNEPPVLVAGTSRRVGGPPVARSPVGDEVLAMLGVPFAVTGTLERAAIGEATPVVVIGGIEDEAVPDMAFYRDGGQVPVMRGRPGAPLLVSY